MHESRLFRIVYYLLDKGRATAPELAKKFEVSVRTIYRDIDSLSGAGIPVFVQSGRNGGIFLMDNFVLDKVILSQAEKQEILSALQSINATKYDESNETLCKLSAIFNVDSGNWLEVDFSRWSNRQNDNKKFELLKSAVINHKAVKITYANSSGEITTREINPLKMVYKSNSWYLKAFCNQKEKYRIFKLTRILNLELLNKSFTYQPFLEKEDFPPQKYSTIKLLFPKEMSYRVYDEFDVSDVTRKQNGDLLVCVQMPQDEWLISFLLSFGTQVEIIEPQNLKSVLAEQAKLIYEKNKS